MIYTLVGMILVFIGIYKLSRLKIIETILFIFIGILIMMFGVIQCQQ